RYFLEVFSEKSGLSVKEVSVNRAPESDSKDRFTIPAKEIKSAYQLNDKDIKFFMRKAQAFSKAVHNVGYNIVPPKNTKWSTRIDARNRLVGWVSCAENDCYFMTVSVNNEPRVVISLDQNRADIFEKDLSENPVCGFSYSLSLLGVEKGDVISVGFLGDSGLAKELIMESDI
ncbi:MAG: hypothetical protein OEY89_15060, partial [Gammaproteobacteria bacterium]|nr:hypothetical protein [Gammaproteobacteria bacterium]